MSLQSGEAGFRGLRFLVAGAWKNLRISNCGFRSGTAAHDKRPTVRRATQKTTPAAATMYIRINVRTRMKSLVVILAALTLVSCNRDPNVAKKRYLENGNKYFAKGKFKEASIMYRNALQKDQRYGLAYYHLAQTDLKLGRIPNALGELRRAIELIPKASPSTWIRKSGWPTSTWLSLARASSWLKWTALPRNFCSSDPNSYDGHRLAADLDFVRAATELPRRPARAGRQAVKRRHCGVPPGVSIKTPSRALRMQLARALAADRQFPEAEKIYRQLIDDDKTLLQAYNELYRLYLRQNKMADAEQVLKTGAANNPKQVGFLVSLASFYSAHGTARRDGGDTQSNQGACQRFRSRILGGGRFLFPQRRLAGSPLCSTKKAWPPTPSRRPLIRSA